MRIGLFGGTFDPPHWGHLILAEWIRCEGKLDKVWLAPARVPPHKVGRKLTDEWLRFKMVKLACADDEFIIASDCDLVHERKPSYTVDLLDELSAKFPDDEFVLVVGADSIVEFTTWHNWREILDRYDIYGLLRPNFDLRAADKMVLEKVKIFKSPLIELSSTMIRQRVREGKSIRFMVPAAVEKFIYEKKLYV